MPLAAVQTAWRALVPLVVAGVVALGVAGAVGARTTSDLPARSANELLADLDRVDVAGYSGTVVQKGRLVDDLANTGSGLSLSTLLAGTNTIKVWYGGPDRRRTAVLGAVGEVDLYRYGTVVWQWDSDSRTAVQAIAASADATATPQNIPIPVDGTTVTPDDLARRVVAAIGEGTSVTLGDPGEVAGRRVYRLVITPPSDVGTRIGQVVLSLDSATRMPLAAQVFALGDDAPVIDLSFTRIAFQVPADDDFRFTPPPGATITAYDPNAPGLGAATNPLLGLRSASTSGSGWTRVAVLTPPSLSDDGGRQAAAPFGSAVKRVSGTWGNGRLLQTALLSVLFVDDGRIVVGAVAPAALYAALR